MGYWQDRQANTLNRLSDRNIRETERQMRKYYEKAMNRTINDFEATYNKILATMAEGKEPTPADLYKLDKYWQSQAQMREELTRLGDKQISLLSKQFETNYLDIYNSFAIAGGPAYSTIDPAMVQQMINTIWCADGLSWSQRVWKNTENLAATLNEELIHCVVSGKKPTELKKILQDRFNVSYSQADTLVRTEISHIQNQAAIQRYKDAGITELQVWATEDERRCEHCKKHHKQRFLVVEAPPVPAHPNCRCNVVPVVEVDL